MRDLKHSAFSTLEEQLKIIRCSAEPGGHDLEPFDEPTRIFGYLVVTDQCRRCGTMRGDGRFDATPASG